MTGLRTRIHSVLGWVRYRWELHKRRDAARQLQGTQSDRWGEAGSGVG
jgi:hypothetical protein